VKLHAAKSMHYRLPPVASCMHVGIQEIALCTDRCGCQKIRQCHPAATQTHSHCNDLDWVMFPHEIAKGKVLGLSGTINSGVWASASFADLLHTALSASKRAEKMHKQTRTSKLAKALWFGMAC